MTTEEIVALLSKDICLHIDMIDSIHKGAAKILYAEEDGVLLYNTSGECYMMSTPDEKAANKMIDMLPSVDLIAVHQDFYLGKLQARFDFKQKMECYQAVYHSKQPQVIPNSGVEIKQLDESFVPIILHHYHHITDENYIYERIKATMYGAFLNDALAGFIGTHPEGSIGMLVVLPAFRRKGIAAMLENHMISIVLSLGYTPYTQVTVDNKASLNLQKKLNLEISETTVTWLF